MLRDKGLASLCVRTIDAVLNANQKSPEIPQRSFLTILARGLPKNPGFTVTEVAGILGPVIQTKLPR